MERTRKLLLASAVLMCGQVACLASRVTYDFSGIVDNEVDYSGLGYVPPSVHNQTSTLIGSFSYENSVSPVFSGAAGTGYRGLDLQLSATVTIDGHYTYTLDAPSSGDEIDIFGSSFNLLKRGPTVYTAFAPNPPFSHFDFNGPTQSMVLTEAVLGASGGGGISDQQTPDAGYYFIGVALTSVHLVPEPGTLSILGFGCIGLLRERKRRIC